jgi:hypothetical protein
MEMKFLKGMKLKPKPHFRFRYNIPEGQWIEVYKAEEDYVELTWGCGNMAVGTFDYTKDFYTSDNVNEEISTFIDNYEIKEATFVTVEGKEISIYIN